MIKLNRLTPSSILNSSIPLILFIILSCFSLKTVNSQIRYTDLVPDITFSETGNPLDINGDGINDFWFVTRMRYSSYWTAKDIMIRTTANSQIAKQGSTAQVVNFGEEINSNNGWTGDLNITMFSYDPYGWEGSGNWLDIDTGYLAARIIVDDEIHYTWINVYKTFTNSTWIVDYGYNLESDSAIIAGLIPPGANTIIGEDIADNFDGSDIKVSFQRANDEASYSKYQSYLAKANDTNAISLEFMNQLPSDRYYTTLISDLNSKNMVNYILDETAVDIYGDSLETLVDYQVHILNIAINGNENENILSAPSEVFKLQATLYNVQNILASDVGDHQNANDISVSFQPILNEQYCSEYRVYANRYHNPNEFDIESAVYLSEDHFTALPIGSNTLGFNLNESQLDTEGNPITDEVIYNIYVLTVPDSIHSLTYTLSEPSNQIMPALIPPFYAGIDTGEHINYSECDSFFAETNQWIINSTVSIDVNRDGVDDYYLSYPYQEHTSNLWSEYHIRPLRENRVLLCEHTEHSWAARLDEYDLIIPDQRWTNQKASLYGYSFDYYGSNQWGHYGSGYLGLCVMDAENPQYAWLKIDLSTFFSYAFEDINIGVEEFVRQRFSIFPNPAHQKIHIEAISELLGHQSYELEILNSLGMVIHSSNYIGESVVVDVSNYSPGIYLIRIKSNGSIIDTHKCLIY